MALAQISCCPFLRTPSAFESVTVRLLPTGALLITLPVCVPPPVFEPAQAAEKTETADKIKAMIIFFINVFLVN